MHSKGKLIIIKTQRNLSGPQKMISMQICGNMKKCFQHSVNFKKQKSLMYFQLCKKPMCDFFDQILKNIKMKTGWTSGVETNTFPSVFQAFSYVAIFSL